jgi:murein DD-endopeptidase MepM/ murein hydrolase activator NlpD
MKNRKKLIAFLAGFMAFVMILSLILSIIPAASAASSSEIKKQIEALQKQRKEMQEMRADIEADLKANEDEIARIIGEKNVIDQEIGILYAEIININDTISAYNLLIADKQDEVDAAYARWEELNEKNKERVRTMEEEGELSYWSVLFKANSFSDLLDRLVMVEEIARADQRRLKELDDAAKVVEAARDELQEEKTGAEETKAELDAAEALLKEKRAQADALINELLAKGEDIHDLLHEAEDAEEDLAAEIAGKQQEYKDAKASEEAAYWEAYWATYVPPTTKPKPTTTTPTSGGTSSGSGGSNSGTTNKPTSSGSWIVPCSYRKISSPFGEREAPTAGASSYHQGVDLAGPEGTPIYASRGGTVTSAKYSNSGGYMVTIDHGDGFKSVYMHMTHYIVSAGQKVSQGQKIGEMGSTGISTGSHLHFGIICNGEYVNPALYVAL